MTATLPPLADASSTPWVQTITGRAVDLLRPHPEQIALADIAHALAHLPRFNGHSRQPWSVAAHSRVVAQIARHAATHFTKRACDDLTRAALLHDAHEAYMGDLVQPMKQALAQVDPVAGAAWRAIEDGLQAAIHHAFSLPHHLPPAWREIIRLADLQALEAERRAFMQPQPRPWMPLPVPPFALSLLVQPPDVEIDSFVAALHATL